MSRFLWQVAASIVVAIAVGALTAYVTGSKVVAVVQARIEAQDKRLSEHDTAIKSLDSDGRALRTEINNTREQIFHELTNVRIDLGKLTTLIEERLRK